MLRLGAATTLTCGLALAPRCVTGSLTTAGRTCLQPLAAACSRMHCCLQPHKQLAAACALQYAWSLV